MPLFIRRLSMIEWLIVPGYFGISFVTYKVSHHIDFKRQFNWYLGEKTRHGCKHAHPNTSHEKWAFDCAVADKAPEDFAVASIFWPFAVIWILIESVGRMASKIPTSRKIENQVRRAELDFRLQKFAEKEGLSWTQDK